MEDVAEGDTNKSDRSDCELRVRRCTIYDKEFLFKRKCEVAPSAHMHIYFVYYVFFLLCLLKTSLFVSHFFRFFVFSPPRYSTYHGICTSRTSL